MGGFVFPGSPATDQTTTNPNGGMYRWDGTKWVIVGLSLPLSIPQGGTAATTAAGALSNLGGLPITGGTLTGPGNLTVNGALTLSADATANLQAVPLQQLNARVPSAPTGPFQSLQSTAGSAPVWNTNVGIGTAPVTNQLLTITATTIAQTALRITGATNGAAPVRIFVGSDEQVRVNNYGLTLPQGGYDSRLNFFSDTTPWSVLMSETAGNMHLAAGGYATYVGMNWRATAPGSAIVHLTDGRMVLYGVRGLTIGQSFIAQNFPRIIIQPEVPTLISAVEIPTGNSLWADDWLGSEETYGTALEFGTGYGADLYCPTWRPMGIFNPTYYWSHPGAGDLIWHTDLGELWRFRRNDSWCYTFGTVGAAAWVDLSDIRTKTAVEPERHGLDVIRVLNPIDFTRVGLPDSSPPPPLPPPRKQRIANKPFGDQPVIPTPRAAQRPQRQIGFSAQEVQTVLPDAVARFGAVLPDGSGGIDSDNPTLGIYPLAIIAMCVNAIKELDARLTDVERR